MPPSELIPTRLMTTMVARMQRTHDRRRASFFVGPPGIGKSTATEAFRATNPSSVMVTRIVKRNVTGPQVLHTLLEALRKRRSDMPIMAGRRSTGEVQHMIAVEIEAAGGNRRRDEDPDLFPKLTIVFDEAQRLTNPAIDALRDWNEPHYYCAGSFPIGMIFVGNEELSLEASKGGMSVLDQGMEDRLLYRSPLTYDDIERTDIERFAELRGVTDAGAVAAIGTAFCGPHKQRSFRRLADFIDELHDEAGGEPVTRNTVRTVLALT